MMPRTGILLCKDGPPFNCIHAHGVIAQHREFVVVVTEVHPAAREVALECAYARTMLTRALAESDSGLVGPLEVLNQHTLAHRDDSLMGPLEVVYLGVRVVILRGWYIVFARLSNSARHDKPSVVGSKESYPYVGRVPIVPIMSPWTSYESVHIGKCDYAYGMTWSTDIVLLGVCH